MRKPLIPIIICYSLAALIIIGLLLVGIMIDPVFADSYTTVSIFIVVPLASLVLGFVVGGAKSYFKWSLPIYMALLTLCFNILIFLSEDWLFVALSFILSLIGVILRSLIIRRKTLKGTGKEGRR